MSYSLTKVSKFLDVGLNIYHTAYVEAQSTGRAMAVGDKIKWTNLDAITGHNSFTLTTFTNSYDMIIPNDGHTYYLIAELNHYRPNSTLVESFAFRFFEGATALGYTGYHMGQYNYMIGQWTGDPHNNDSDDAARICVKGPKTLNLKLTEANGNPTYVVDGVAQSNFRQWEVEARMLVWKI